MTSAMIHFRTEYLVVTKLEQSQHYFSIITFFQTKLTVAVEFNHVNIVYLTVTYVPLNNNLESKIESNIEYND